MSSGGHEIPRYLFELGLLGVDLSHIIRIHKDMIFDILLFLKHHIYMILG
jgi:hypothetical protein